MATKKARLVDNPDTTAPRKNKRVAYTVLAVTALLLAIVPVTWQTQNHVSACAQAPGCVFQNQQPVGTLTTRNYGFPATYRQVVSFNPDNNDERSANYAGFAKASIETRGSNTFLAAVNMLFWFTLLYVLYEKWLTLKRPS